MTFYGEGKNVINVSTYDQCARAVMNLLSLKIQWDGDDDKEVTLTRFRNDFVYISSFVVSQKDIFESVLRVTGATEQDWKMTHQDHRERYVEGIARSQRGERIGYE